MKNFLRRGRLLYSLRCLVALGCVVALPALSSRDQRTSFDSSQPSSDPVFAPLDLQVVTGQRRRASPADVLFTQTLHLAFPLSLLVGAAFWAVGQPCVGPAVLALAVSLHFWAIPSAKRQALTLDHRCDVTTVTTTLCRLDGWIIWATILALATINGSQISGMGMPVLALQTTMQTHKANVLAPGVGDGGVDHSRVRSTTIDGDRWIDIRQPLSIRIPREDKDLANIVMVLLNRSIGPDGRRYLDQSTIGDIFGISRQGVNVRISAYNRRERIVDVTSGRRHGAAHDLSLVEEGTVSILDDVSLMVDEQEVFGRDVPGNTVRQEAVCRGELATDDQNRDGQKIALTTSFQPFLQAFASAFQRRSFSTFQILATGWILTTGRHTITGVIRTVKGYEIKSFSTFHVFFSRAKWSFDDLWPGLFKMVLVFVPANEKVQLNGDDTLARKNGPHICGGGMHHDPLLSRPKRVFLHFGHNWVVVCVVLRLWFIPGKGIPIPVLARLYRPKNDCERRGVEYRTHTQMMSEMVTTVASWAPDRFFVFAGDSAYGCEEVVKHVPANVECVSRLRMDAALYEPAPSPQKGDRGRPRKKGQRLPTPKMIAEDPKIPWTEIKAFLYGRKVTTTTKVTRALWYTTAGDRLLTIVVVRDPSRKRHDEAFFSTDLTMTPKQVVERYALRWPLETLFQNSKQYLGFEDPQNRTDQAVERTAPFALFLTGLVVVWFSATWRTAQRFLPQVGPWYTRKDAVGITFADMLAALRQMSYREMITNEAAGKPLPRKSFELVLHLLGAST